MVLTKQVNTSNISLMLLYLRHLFICQECDNIAEFALQFDIYLRNPEICVDNWVSKALFICFFYPSLARRVISNNQRRRCFTSIEVWAYTQVMSRSRYIDGTEWDVRELDVLNVSDLEAYMLILVSDRHSSLWLETDFWCVRY